MPLLGTGLLKKMLVNDVRSRNVYENKGSMDKMTTKKSDIYGNPPWIFQKNSGSEGQPSLIDAFRAGFVRIFAARISPSPGRAPGSPLGNKRLRPGRGETRPQQAYPPEVSPGLGLCQPPSEAMIASATLGPQLPRL